MIPIKAARFDTNDEMVKLVQWLVHDGDKVEDGAAIAILETSKATFDMVADKGGFFKSKAVEGQEYSYEDVIGNFFETKEEMLAFQEKSRKEPSQQSSSGVVLSKGAQKLVSEKGITEQQIKALAKPVVREADILALLSHSDGPAKEEGAISKHQRAVAKTVMRSHLEIPAAFVTMRIYCDRLLEAIAQIRARDGIMLGIPEALACSLGKLNKEYPSFYGNYKDDTFIPAGQDCSVAVTFDIGQGLFLPKLPQAGSKTMREIVQWFAVCRARALRNSFKPEDLEPADISFSINTEKDVEFVQPFISPPQVCILSMGSIFADWSDGGAKQPLQASKYFVLGLAYDHRVNNGAKAIEFLKAIKGTLEGDLMWMGNV